MSAPTLESSRSRGRPRDPGVDRRILEVALRHLSVHGYTRMSIDGIAIDAGVSKPTIYRRWPCKVDVAVAAISLLRDSPPFIPTGSPLDDLKQCLSQFRHVLHQPNGASLLGVVLAEEQHTPELLAQFRELVVSTRKKSLHAILVRARREGLIEKNADLDVAVAMMVGPFYAQRLEGFTVSDKCIGEIVKGVWAAIAKR